MYSLKKRLAKSLIMNLIVIMLLLLVILNIFIQKLIMENVLSRLKDDAESVVSRITYNKDQQWEVDPLLVSSVYNRVRSGHYYVVKSADKISRSRSLFDFEFSIKDLSDGRGNSYQMSGPGHERWLVWQQNILKNNQKFQIWIAEDISGLQQELFRFALTAIFLIIIFSVILIFMQQKILNRAFVVFDMLRFNLQAIRQGEAEKTGARVPVEISPLVAEIEMLVDQLKKRIQRSRNAIGNLAHEIKRPLQLLSLHIETGENKEMAIQSFADIQKIVDRELRRAKISGSNVTGGEFNAKEELPVLIQVMDKIYPDVRINLNIHTELEVVSLDRDDMMELTGNLIDNACKFASYEVHVNILLEDNNWLFKVEDDGQGVDQQQMEMITSKGVRLDESKQGHGLGLTICADIADSYHGTLSFDKSALGGLKVEVRLPLKV